MKTSRKVQISSQCFYTFLKMHYYAKQYYRSLPISYNFHDMLLLVNVNFLVNFASNLVNFAGQVNGF